MPRLPTPLPREVKAAAFTLAQGRSIGLGDKRMRGRDLQRPVRGVRQTAGDLPAGSWPADVWAAAEARLRDRCAAVALVVPEGAFLSHLTAARL